MDTRPDEKLPTDDRGRPPGVDLTALPAPPASRARDDVDIGFGGAVSAVVAVVVAWADLAINGHEVTYAWFFGPMALVLSLVALLARPGGRHRRLARVLAWASLVLVFAGTLLFINMSLTDSLSDVNQPRLLPPGSMIQESPGLPTTTPNPPLGRRMPAAPSSYRLVTNRASCAVGVDGYVRFDGTITNTTGSTSNFTVEVEIRDSSNTLVGSPLVDTVYAVKPGDAATWRVVTQVDAGTQPTCTVTSVSMAEFG